MPPTASPVRISEPQKIETARPQPAPAPRTKSFTIKAVSVIPA